jgi:hypothetical protein
MEYSLPGMVADINGDGHPDILSAPTAKAKQVLLVRDDGTAGTGSVITGRFWRGGLSQVSLRSGY